MNVSLDNFPGIRADHHLFKFCEKSRDGVIFTMLMKTNKIPTSTFIVIRKDINMMITKPLVKGQVER